MRKNGSMKDVKAAVVEAIARGNIDDARRLLRPGRPGTPPPEAVDLRPLAGAPLMSALSREELLGLVGEVELQVAEAGERIITEGQPGTSMYAIAYGAVEVVRAVPGDLRNVIARLETGEFFGEMALVANVPRIATVEAVEETGLVELTRDRLAVLAETHPHIEEVLVRYYKERLLEDLVEVSTVLRALDGDARRAAVEKFGIGVAEKGRALLREGEPGTGFHILLRGSVSVAGTAADGTPIRYPDLYEGDVFGEISLVHDTDATATVTALERCVIIGLARKDFDEIVLSSPEAREAVLALADERLERMYHLSHQKRQLLRAHTI